MLGLKRGTVALAPHREEWRTIAENTIEMLKLLLKNTVVDLQHIGSTAILNIDAKPIIDLVVGVRILNDILPYVDLLKQNGIVFCGKVIVGEILFVMGDFEKDIRTHHIHIVKYGGTEWKNYINFRDYLNALPEKAMIYEACKKKLAMRFYDDRKSYTAGKKEIIDTLLKEARIWNFKLQN